MLKRSLALVAMLTLGLMGCEVQNDTDATEGDGVEQDTTGDVGPTDPCPGVTGWACDETCAIEGTFDPDCFVAGGCDASTQAKDLIKAWKAEGWADQLPTTSDKCDFNPGVCEIQFKCNTIPCFCDEDCYVKNTDGTWATPPTCTSDGHCDTWCVKGTDPDCANNPDDGKYCGN